MEGSKTSSGEGGEGAVLEPHGQHDADEQHQKKEEQREEKDGDYQETSLLFLAEGDEEGSADEIDWATSQSLSASGVEPEELNACVSVLQRLVAAKGNIDWNSRGFRHLRKACSSLVADAFEGLPQKDDMKARERAKFEKNNKRERRLRQLEADRKWKENAELRASRLQRLAVLEGQLDDGGKAAAASPNMCIEDEGKDTLALEDGQGDASPAVASSLPRDSLQAPRRIPDGPAGSSVTPADGGTSAPSEECYTRQQACYICKARFAERHHFYAVLCPTCADLNYFKRTQSCDLHGRVCLVTGARLKIGFQTALKLLRMGARVIATTRFPADALQRYQAEQDCESWIDNLAVVGVDFRFLGTVQAFCENLCRSEQHLDVIVNNACQTIRRPAGFYRHLLESEGRAKAKALGGSGPHGIQTLEPGDSEPKHGSSSPAASLAVAADGGVVHSPDADSAFASQLVVLEEDSMGEARQEAMFPAGQLDSHGQQLDLRDKNSWLLKLGEVSTAEAVEVFCINTMAPFVINSCLRPLLEQSPHPDRYIVNVSAMEGKFYRYKQPTHPHTNMAKAALNMMTRTCAEELVKQSGIYMNSVDTGWVNDENPIPTATRIASDHGFQTPIDEIDAAARILDPVLLGMQSLAESGDAAAEIPGRGPRRRKGAGSTGGENLTGTDGSPVWGKFFKDYVPTEW